jgi:cyclin-dependent kinase
VLPLLESFHDGNGHLVIVTPFLPLSLDALMRDERATSSSPAVVGPLVRAALRDVVAALAHVHRLGIVHRDVKPSNVLLAHPRGPAYLADFGIAWMAGDGASERVDDKITDVGTTCYRAPEVLFGCRAYDASFDMWALGCMVAEAALGRELWEAGEVGTELMLVKSLLEGLGTPDEEVWPEMATMPDWGKIEFVKFPRQSWEELLPGVEDDVRDLVSGLVKWSGSQRLTAEDVSETWILAMMMSLYDTGAETSAIWLRGSHGELNGTYDKTTLICGE